jgi:ATP-dependent Clp protease ATP-binding subunit ClpA
MYERFTDIAERAMQLANREAQRLNHEYIGTEHILLGIVREGTGIAAHVLKNFDIDLGKVRLFVERIVAADPEERPIPGTLPQTPRAQHVVQCAIEVANRLSHDYVGTEHLLLALCLEKEGVAAQVLMDLGLTLAAVRAETLQLLGKTSVYGPEESVPATAYDDLPADRRALLLQLNRQIGQLQWDKEAAVAEQRYEAAAALFAEIRTLEAHKQAVLEGRPVDTRIQGAVPSDAITRPATPSDDQVKAGPAPSGGAMDE